MSSRRGNATLIGAFVVGGLVLVLLAVIIAGGGRFFTRKERAVMHFSGSIYGLEVGAPVVFRGVRVGSVTSIGLVYDSSNDAVSIPVVAELESRAIRGIGKAADGSTPVLNTLLAKGLKAQLSMQSLLTGQLYVDLDLRPDKPTKLGGAETDEIEIPTTPAAIQNLKQQFDAIDFGRITDDLSAIAASARQLVAGPELQKALTDAAEITGSLRRIGADLEKQLPPLASAARTTIVDARKTLDSIGGAADRVDRAAAQLGTAAEHASALLAPDSALLRSVQRSADELARAATSLRQQTADDAPLVQGASRALQDVSRAAREMRELADLLERHPEALLRGRGRSEAGDAVPPPSSPTEASK